MRRSTAIVFLVLTVIPLCRFALTTFEAHAIERPSADAWAARADVISRAQIFAGSPDIRSLDLSSTPGDSHPFDVETLVTCRYVPKAHSGTSAKFDCRLPDNSIVKVKYGWTPEIRAEVAATRLISALGFAADHVSIVHRLRCDGCIPLSFELHGLAEQYFAAPLIDRAFSTAHWTFNWVSVERKFKARTMDFAGVDGWSFFDLQHVNPANGGATRADVDALRLISVFMSHWDNKPSNQRLVCLDPPGDTRVGSTTPCARPLLMLQDLGATFGPSKLDYTAWVNAPIWSDARTCEVSMETMPYHGSAFPPVNVSEAGRVLLASRLRQLSDRQVTDLFSGARFPDPASGDVPARDITPWVRAFLDKVRQIADRPPCPT